MLIGICGSICSGKSTVAQYLIEHHGFKHLHVEPHSSLTADGSGESIEVDAQSLQGHRLSNGSTTPHRKRLALRRASSSLSFPTPDALLEFVTTKWRERWVTTDVFSRSVLEAYSRRPFFLLISVDAPVTVRWKRCQQRQHLAPEGPDQTNGTTSSPSTLEDFVTLSDTHLFDPNNGQAALISSASVRLLNTSNDLAHLYVNLGKVDLLNEDRLRPSWDTYFMALASLAAQRSNCMKRRVGCVVVQDKRVISTGYNGTPRGIRNCGEGGCPRCNDGLGSGHGLATCLCIHAEENALLEAGRDRIRNGAILYCDTCPCLTCSIKIAQVGISEVVYNHGYSMDTETASVFRESGVMLRQFVPPANGLIHLEKMELYK